MRDGSGAVLLASEQAIKDYGLTPLARFVSFSVAGVRPEVMGIGPIAAIPKALKQAGLTKDQLDWIELNEAFAAQSLAVIRDSELDPDKVNPLGGAIALGHPLGATGAVRTATIVHGLRRRQQKYGMVTMCIGTGRSEEHTSELQSLMRNSYAVFCLKKKQTIHTTSTTQRQCRRTKPRQYRQSTQQTHSQHYKTNQQNHV